MKCNCGHDKTQHNAFLGCAECKCRVFDAEPKEQTELFEEGR